MLKGKIHRATVTRADLNYIGSINAHQTVIPEFKAQEGLFISPDDNNTILEGTTFSFFGVDDNNTIKNKSNETNKENSDDIMSFGDELEVPTFLRNKNS